MKKKGFTPLENGSNFDNEQICEECSFSDLPHKRKNKSLTGFTLIEIIIVLAVAMILLAIGVFNYQGSKASSELTIAAEELFGNLKFARQYALSSGGSSVTFASGRYYVKSAAGETLKTKVLPSHISLSVAPSGITAVTFSSNGSADYDATVTISSAKTNRTKTISVTAASGMIYKN